MIYERSFVPFVIPSRVSRVSRADISNLKLTSDRVKLHRDAILMCIITLIHIMYMIHVISDLYPYY
jgi:hypothetical protein